MEHILVVQALIRCGEVSNAKRRDRYVCRTGKVRLGVIIRRLKEQLFRFTSIVSRVHFVYCISRKINHYLFI